MTAGSGSRWRAAAVVVALVAAAVPLLLASPRVADALERLAESSARDTSRRDLVYDAVIVLGGSDARIAAAGTIMREGRARYVLYSGAVGAADATRARRKLQEAGAPDRLIVIEDRSRNTHENAVETSRIVAARHWRSLLLVTSAAHVDRALGCFHDLGLSPDVLPVERTVGPPPSDWRPRRQAIVETRAALHELIGRVVYRVLGYAR